ncbi:hypothetical protein [Sporichthya sp.]|uniref:hypothetical protein n=1 Tax=Sporichthya sp. TaxID=65475 RepID=UPI0017E637BF|nr:hypothetical protein [Sporichthya sp.]MBA3741847.1 hypothetical protein [Sporichthya sp.]
MRRIGAQLAGIAVLVAAMGPLGSAEAVAEALALPDSSKLSSPVVLHGYLTDEAGAALSGAEVLLSAWPSNETVKAMPIGGTFRTVPVARAVADSTGAYTLRSALTPTLATLIDRDGLDLQVDFAHEGQVRTYLTQAVPGGALGWLRPTVEAVDPAQLVAALPRNSMNIALDDDGPHPCGDTEGCEDKPRPYPGLPSGCVNRKIAVKEAWTTVATALARKGVTAKVSYERGAQSEVSTGISYEGSGGSFKANGSRTRGSTFEADFFDQKGTKKAPAHVEYQVEMAHAVIASECNGNKIGQYRYRQFTTDPLGTTGASKPPIPSTLPLWTCAKSKQVGGLRTATVSDRAYTYERGFGFSPVPGGSFTGAATSGYSETVKVEYVFAKSKVKDNFWCGLTGFPVSPGQRVQAFQR